MSQPVRDVELLKAMQRIQTNLRAINGQGGYHFSIKPTSVVLDPINLLLVHASRTPMLSLELTDTGQRDYQPAMMMDDRRVLALTARVDAPGDSYDRKTIAAAQLEADIERALGADPDLGGLAVDCTLRQASLLTGDQTSDIVILLVLIDVQLYRSYGHPEGL